MTVQEFVNIDKDLQTVQDISDVNMIILIYLFIKHVLFILMYLHEGHWKPEVMWSYEKITFQLDWHCDMHFALVQIPVYKYK
jgi:hypothetical protein